MIPVSDNIRHTLRNLILKDRVVFAIVSTLVFGLVLEISIVRVSVFPSSDIYTDIEIFVLLEALCLISQFIILNFVHNKISNIFSSKKSQIRVIHKAMLVIQIGIITLLLVTLYEVTFTSSYHLVLLEVIFLSSSLTATCVMGLLSFRFIKWLRADRKPLTAAYLLASSSFSITTAIGIAYVLVQLSDVTVPYIVHPKLFGEFVMHSNIGNPLLGNSYAISSAIAFVLLWIGTVFLLRSYGRKLGRLRYWIIMSVPLVYFLSQFEPAVLNIYFSGSLDNPVIYTVLYIILVIGTRPVGGILFGLSFIQVGRKVHHEEVKSYMTISAIGLLLLLVSYQAQVLITAPFPPFGLLSVSFMGLSSYLIFIGIYSSAVSVSEDSRLRSAIRKSVETELRFIGNIADAEMDNKIIQNALNVLRIEERNSDNIYGEPGVESSLTDKEITEYIDEVLRETKKRSL